MLPNLDRRALLAAGASALAFTATPLRASAQAAAKLPPAPAPELWARSPALFQVCLSPEATRLAYFRDENGNQILTTVTLPDGKAQAFNVGATEVIDLQFIDEDHVVTVTRSFASGANDKRRHSTATIFGLKDRSVKALFSDIPGFSGEILGPVTVVRNNGKRQVVAGAIKPGAADFLYIYRFDTGGSGSMLDQSPTATRHVVLAADGQPVAREIYYEHNRVYNIDYRQGGSWKTILTGKYEVDRPQLLCLSADGKSVVIRRYDSDGDVRYYDLSPEGAVSAPFPYTADRAAVLIDPVSKQMNGHLLHGDWPTYVYDDPAMAALVKKAQDAVPGYRMSIADRADDPSKMIVYSEGDDDAGTYYFIDFGKGGTLTVGSAYPDIAPEWISHKTAITYKAADGLDIPAFLTLPPNRDAKNLPLIVIAHDGPEDATAFASYAQSRVRPGEAWGHVDLSFDADVQAYAAMGYAVLQPNYRGTSNYGGAFRAAGFSQWGRKMQSDLSDGVKSLAAQGTIDPKRVAIIGEGFGGSLALGGMTFEPGTYCCSIDLEGPADIHTYMDSLRGFNTSDTNYIYRAYQRWAGDTSVFDSISPAKSAARVQGAVLILNNDSDDGAQSRAMAAALKGAGKDVTLVIKDYDYTQAENIATMTMIAAFLKQHNPPA